MSLVCDHLRSKAAHGVPDAGATLSLLRHQADTEADEAGGLTLVHQFISSTEAPFLSSSQAPMCVPCNSV